MLYRYPYTAPPKSKTGLIIFFFLFLIILISAGLSYYFLVYKKKTTTTPSPSSTNTSAISANLYLPWVLNLKNLKVNARPDTEFYILKDTTFSLSISVYGVLTLQIPNKCKETLIEPGSMELTYETYNLLSIYYDGYGNFYLSKDSGTAVQMQRLQLLLVDPLCGKEDLPKGVKVFTKPTNTTAISIDSMTLYNIPDTGAPIVYPSPAYVPIPIIIHGGGGVLTPISDPGV